MKPLRPLPASGNPTRAPAGSMPVASYLAAIEALSADDPVIDTPVYIPPGWALPADAVLGKPFAWIIRHVLGCQLWEQQLGIVRAVQSNSRVSVRACQASGKSYASAALVLAFLLAYKDAVCVSTAPGQRQISGILWAAIAEIFQASRLPLPGDLLQTSYKLAPNRFALGFASQAATGESMAIRHQGWHGEHVLVIVDEASGVAQSVYDSLRGSLTSADSHLLLIGNPNETSGYFFDSHNSLRSLFHTIHISYRDTPNFQGHGEVAPYLITQRFVDEAMAEWGMGNPQFDVRVLGEFPQQGSDSLIPLMWAEQATKREAPAAPARPVYEMGVDVARFGNDETAVCIRSGDEVVRLEAWAKFDTMYSADRVAALAKKYRVSAIRIDAVGVGGGVVDRLRQLQDAGDLPLGVRLTEFNAAAKPRDPERFRMRRDETWQGLRDRFKEGRIAKLPDDQKLIGQLCSIRFFFDATNRMQCESKDKLKDRGLKSPDRAEALMLAFTVDRPVGEGQTFDKIMEHALGGGLFKVDLDNEGLQW